MSLSNWDILLRLAIATVLGILFGLERTSSKKPVGARTHVLICIAACIITMISAYGFSDIYQTYPKGLNANTDPARLIVGILTGVGFIGAGIIWRSNNGGVQGITTAAEIVLLTALGISCGLGLYFLTVAGATIALLNMTAHSIRNRIIQPLIKKIFKNNLSPKNSTNKAQLESKKKSETDTLS